MKNISTFSEFNENNSFVDKLKSIKKSIKGGLFSGFNNFRTEYSKELSQYGLYIKSVSEQEINILHNKRVVANISLDLDSNIPTWILTVYFYESEVKSNNEKVYKKIEISNQKEQPYAQGKKIFKGDSDNVIFAFIKWWSTNTNSGKLKNPIFKLKK
jgi:hypothetical protein